MTDSFFLNIKIKKTTNMDNFKNLKEVIVFMKESLKD
jgi:hypothetical protein